MGMIILFALLVILVGILITYVRKKSFGKFSKLSALIGLILVHFQILFGIVLYLLSPLGASNFSGDAMGHTIARFYSVEHPIGMILAAILITIGYRRAKNTARSDAKRHQQILIFYGMAFAVISYLIPWFLWS